MDVVPPQTALYTKRKSLKPCLLYSALTRSLSEPLSMGCIVVDSATVFGRTFNKYPAAQCGSCSDNQPCFSFTPVLQHVHLDMRKVSFMHVCMYVSSCLLLHACTRQVSAKSR